MSRNESIRGIVVFDLDGTLSDTSEDIAFSANFIRRRLKKTELTTEEVMAHVGHGAPHLLKNLTGLEERTEGPFAELFAEYQDHYITHQTQHSKLYPGIRDLLNRLKQDKYDLYILSNKPHQATIGEARGLEIESLFQNIWGAGSLPALKPDPVGIQRAMEQSGATAQQTVMVGDMTPDIEVAKAANVSSIYVTWGFRRLDLSVLNPTGVADNSAQLGELINSLAR